MLPTYGNIRYGNLALNGPDVRTTKFSAEPEMDPSGRGRMFTRYRIGASITITGEPTDDAVQKARETLNTPGLTFVYADRGFGEVRADGKSDVLWGPKCRVVNITPLGGGNACQLDWEAEVAIGCEDAVLTTNSGLSVGAIHSWTYTASFEIDSAGYTTRRIAVEIKVPGGRRNSNRGSRELKHTADEYRRLLAPPGIPGFRRTYPGWTIDAAKTTCTGEIVDEEMGVNFPPEWVAEFEANHEVGSMNQGLSMWSATINAKYELIKDCPKPTSEAVRHFIGVVVKDRVLGVANKLGKTKSTIVPISLRMREPEIAGRRKAEFSFTFSYTRQLKEIMNATGLWRPVPHSNWAIWAHSMQSGPANPFGYAGLQIKVDDDSIVDACGGSVPGLFRTRPKVPRPSDGPSVIGGGTVTPWDEDIKTWFPEPTPESSWLHYNVWYWLEVDSGTLPVKTLPKKKIPPPKTLIPHPQAPPGSNVYVNPLPNLVPPKGGKEGGRLEAQLRKPLVYMFIRGQAARYGFPIPIPEVDTVNGVEPVMATRLDHGEGFGQGIVYAAGGAPIYGATWNLRYLLPELPEGWFPPTPPNPILFK